MTSRTKRAGILGLFVAAALAPLPARATPQHVVSCTATGAGGTACYFTCQKGEKVAIVVENATTSSVITATALCGSRSKSVSSSGAQPPANVGSKNWVMPKDYTPDDATDPANCYTNFVGNQAEITVSCSRVVDPEEARGEGEAVADVEFSPPVGQGGDPTALVFSSTLAHMAVVDGVNAQLFSGAVTVSATGVSDGPEACALGTGVVALSLAGEGLGTIGGTGTGFYERVGPGLRIVVLVEDLTVNGMASAETVFELVGLLSTSPEGNCATGEMGSATFVGAATIGS